MPSATINGVQPSVFPGVDVGAQIQQVSHDQI